MVHTKHIHSSDECCEEDKKPGTHRKKFTWKIGNFWKTLAYLLLAILTLTQLSGYTLNAELGSFLHHYRMARMEAAVLPAEGVILPVSWGSIGRQMVDLGIVDREKLIALYGEREGLTTQANFLLSDVADGPVVINSENAPVLLNLLWAFGLGNKNRILEKGPMTDEHYGGDAGRFASTAGWTLAKGDPMSHYSQHELVTLSSEQQALVEEVSKNIYRPCCGNSVYFPDCNHGMAMLGLLELMAASGASVDSMYKTAMYVNAYWFPDTYLTIAKYMDEVNGLSWKKVDPKIVLGSSYSSAAGIRGVMQEIEPPVLRGGPSCSV